MPRSPRPLLAAAALAGAALAAAPLAGPWQLVFSTDGSQFTKRHEASMAAHGGDLYLLGGRGQRPVERFDPVAGTWTNLGLPPFELNHFQPVPFDGKLYVLGAFTGPYPHETSVPDVWVYDPAQNTWTQGDPIPANRRRGSAAAVARGDAIYLVGGNTNGHDGGAVPWLDRYEPVTGTWTVLPDAPHARDHFAAAVVGNRIVCAGGRTTEQPNPFLNTVAAVDAFDVSTSAWTSLPLPIPTERAGTMTVAVDEHVIVIGGESATQAHAATEVLDAHTGEWRTLPSLVQARHSGGAALVGLDCHVAAGAGAPGGNPELNTQERLDLVGLLSPSAMNLVANGDADAGLADWIDQGDLALAPAGSVAAPSVGIANGWAGLAAPGAPLETYTLRCVARRSGGGSATLALDFLDGGGALLGGESLAIAAAADWATLALVGTTPAGTQTVRARFEATGGAQLEVDDVVLLETPGEVPRLGVPANPWALLASTNGPVLGGVWNPSIDHAVFAPTSTVDVLAIGVLPANFFAPPLGTILVSPVGVKLRIKAPGVPFTVPLPNDPSFVGAALTAQGASLVGAVTPLTNALDLTLQAP